MVKYKITKEEDRKIKKAIHLVIKDIRNLYKISKLPEMKIGIKSYINGDNASLNINRNEVFLTTFNSFYTKQIYLEKRQLGINKITNYDFLVCIDFLRQYEEIRKQIISTIMSSNITVDLPDNSNKLEEVINAHDRTTIVELNLPISKNLYSIDIKKNDSVTIGDINIGNQLIRLITKSDIVLFKDVSEIPKVKYK